MGCLEAREAFRTDGQGRLKDEPPQRIEPLTQELQDAKSVTVKTGRTGAGTADNNCGLGGRCHRLAARRADSVMARNPWGLQRKGRRYVCSPPRFAEAPRPIGIGERA